MGQQPALGIEHQHVCRSQFCRFPPDHPIPVQPLLAERIGAAGIEQAEINPRREEGCGHEIFGKAFHIPGRIALPGGGKHVVVGIFVQQHLLAEFPLGGERHDAAIAGIVEPGDIRTDLAERHGTGNRIDDIDIQFRRRIIHLGRGEFAQQSAIIFQQLCPPPQISGRHVGIHPEMRRFRHPPRRRTGGGHHKTNQQEQQRTHQASITTMRQPSTIAEENFSLTFLPYESVLDLLHSDWVERDFLAPSCLPCGRRLFSCADCHVGDGHPVVRPRLPAALRTGRPRALGRHRV